MTSQYTTVFYQHLLPLCTIRRKNPHTQNPTKYGGGGGKKIFVTRKYTKRHEQQNHFISSFVEGDDVRACNEIQICNPRNELENTNSFLEDDVWRY